MIQVTSDTIHSVKQDLLNDPVALTNDILYLLEQENNLLYIFTLTAKEEYGINIHLLPYLIYEILRRQAEREKQ